MRISDWSSDVCSSDLEIALVHEKLLRTPLSAEGQARIAARQGEHSALDLEFRCADVVVREHSVFECRHNGRRPEEIPALDVHPALRVRQRPGDRKSTRLNSSHSCAHRMPSSACKKKKN